MHTPYWSGSLMTQMKKCRRRKRSSLCSLAELVCDAAVFADGGVRAAQGHPKALMLPHNNTRKSMKGRSDKVEINQRADLRGLRRGIKEWVGFLGRLHFCASVSGYFYH